MKTYTYPLAHPEAVLETVGGKGASLRRLAQAGLPVPDGFNVTTAAYRQFMAENELQPRIMQILQSADVSQLGTLQGASQAIQELFAAVSIPQPVSEAIELAYASLPGVDWPAAVRSSATAEDLPDLSFAGQQETYLNVHGIHAVLDAVRKCWASLWTARAIGYRLQHGVDQNSVALAVVIQTLVPAEAAGILFTANPVNGNRSQALVSAAWGLGEAVVGGLVTPDSITVEKSSQAVVERQTAEKLIMTVCTAFGTQEQPVPEALRRLPVLDDAAAAELTRLSSQIEQQYGMPMDIEWARADGQFYILQARPITALPEESGPVPTEWPIHNPKAMYVRGSLAEHLPNPVSPLFGTLGIRLANQTIMVLGDEFLGGTSSMDYQYRIINGYTYLGIVFGLKEILTFTRVAIAQMNNMFGKGTQRWLAARQKLIDLIARWEARPVAQMENAELLLGVEELFYESTALYTVLQSGTLPTATSSEMIFTNLYNRLVKRNGDPEATVFLFGLDTVPVLADKSLFDLADWAREQPVLSVYLLGTPADKLADDLRKAEAPATLEAEIWNAWRGRFQEHLKNFGQCVFEYDFINPTPGEAPDVLLDAVKLFLAGKGVNPYLRQADAAERREAATKRILSRLRWPVKGWFVKSLRWAQRTGPVREDSLADLGMTHPLGRRMLNELGRRLVQGGAIADAGEIYWLEEAELRSLLASLERGEALPGMAETIRLRKATWRGQLKAAFPAMLPETSRWAKMIPWSGNKVAGAVLKGTGTGGGKVTAPACVLFGPDDFSKMKPGDILVAVTTTPAWTPLFALAAAVVTDIGGPLSHSSIVAREYGVPAVTALGIATRRIRSGQMITVDGSAGTVTLDGSLEQSKNLTQN